MDRSGSIDDLFDSSYLCKFYIYLMILADQSLLLGDFNSFNEADFGSNITETGLDENDNQTELNRTMSESILTDLIQNPINRSKKQTQINRIIRVSSSNLIKSCQESPKLNASHPRKIIDTSTNDEPIKRISSGETSFSQFSILKSHFDGLSQHDESTRHPQIISAHQSNASLEYYKKLAKQQQQIMKNREAAYQSRQRKKEYLERLEMHVGQLRDENHRLRLENEEWRAKCCHLEVSINSLDKRIRHFVTNSNGRENHTSCSIIKEEDKFPTSDSDAGSIGSCSSSKIARIICQNQAEREVAHNSLSGGDSRVEKNSQIKPSWSNYKTEKSHYLSQTYSSIEGKKHHETIPTYDREVSQSNLSNINSSSFKLTSSLTPKRMKRNPESIVKIENKQSSSQGSASSTRLFAFGTGIFLFAGISMIILGLFSPFITTKTGYPNNEHGRILASDLMNNKSDLDNFTTLDRSVISNPSNSYHEKNVSGKNDYRRMQEKLSDLLTKIVLKPDALNYQLKKTLDRLYLRHRKDKQARLPTNDEVNRTRILKRNAPYYKAVFGNEGRRDDTLYFVALKNDQQLFWPAKKSSNNNDENNNANVNHSPPLHPQNDETSESSMEKETSPPRFTFILSASNLSDSTFNNPKNQTHPQQQLIHIECQVLNFTIRPMGEHRPTR